MSRIENKKPEELKETEAEIKKDDLEVVTGGSNPFENVPRVPEKPIDDELRQKG